VTYALLIYRALPASEQLPERDERLNLEGHRSLQAEAAGRSELHAVAQLGDPGRALTVRRRGGAHDVSDGPYAETKEWLVGFYLVDCTNDEAALTRARMICDDDHAVEVRPVAWRWKK
jgi:hypothetical protein